MPSLLNFQDLNSSFTHLVSACYLMYDIWKTLNGSLLNVRARCRVGINRESKVTSMSQFSQDFLSFHIESARETGTGNHPTGNHLTRSCPTFLPFQSVLM